MKKNKALEAPAREVAQIVYYLGTDGARVIRYTSMKKAQKQFDELVNNMADGGPAELTGDTATAWIKNAENISDAFLVDIDANQRLMADTQVRFNYMMQQQVPLPG